MARLGRRGTDFRLSAASFPDAARPAVVFGDASFELPHVVDQAMSEVFAEGLCRYRHLLNLSLPTSAIPITMPEGTAQAGIDHGVVLSRSCPVVARAAAVGSR